MKKFIIDTRTIDGVATEYAVFKDGTGHKRILEDTYGKYFEADNELNELLPFNIECSFYGRIYDAVKTIRNNNGDCIKVDDNNPMDMVVKYYIDRTVGVKIRKRFLHDWSYRQFGYSIEYRKKNFGNDRFLVGISGEAINLKNGNFDDVSIFRTDESAKEFMKQIILKAYPYAEKFVEYISEVGLIHAIVDINKDIKEKTFVDNHIFFEIITDMIDSHYALINQAKDLESYHYDIVQAVYPNGYL